MRRVVSVFLPTWPTDRLRRGLAPPPETVPLITARPEGGRLVIGGACALARDLGLIPGMAVATARALVPGLHVADANPEADAAALRRLAGWALKFTPLTAADPPDGLFLDITGCAHLLGGESALLDALCDRLAAAGFFARAAVADTPGAAHALARHGAASRQVASGDLAALLDPLPVAALRLAEPTVRALHRVGLETVGQLRNNPRGPLVRRYGAGLAARLDQAFGAVFESISPVLPPVAIAHRLAFLEPLLTAEALTAAIAELTAAVCAALERAGEGARQLDLLFCRVDGSWQATRIGTARPVREPRHLARLLTERLDQIDPGLGVEAMQLIVSLAETHRATQTSTGGGMADAPGADAPWADAPGIAELVDRLAGRLGTAAVYRIAPVESEVPERVVRRVAPLSPPTGANWPAELPRPARLLRPPQPVSVLALLPDHPPARFTWRRVSHVVRRADGPERIFGEWWVRDAELSALRDYFVVENTAGRRFWLFRRGDGVDPATGDRSWFLHGLF